MYVYAHARVCVCEVCPCHGVSVEVRGQRRVLGLTFSLYTGPGDLSSGAQAWAANALTHRVISLGPTHALQWPFLNVEVCVQDWETPHNILLSRLFNTQVNIRVFIFVFVYIYFILK